MSAPGFVSPDGLEFAVLDGEPELKFWRQTVGVIGSVLHGDFPHTAMAPREQWCASDLYIRVPETGDVFALGCTREVGHSGGLHVAHEQPGYPLAAWEVNS